MRESEPKELRIGYDLTNKTNFIIYTYRYKVEKLRERSFEIQKKIRQINFENCIRLVRRTVYGTNNLLAYNTQNKS